MHYEADNDVMLEEVSMDESVKPSKKGKKKKKKVKPDMDISYDDI